MQNYINVHVFHILSLVFLFGPAFEHKLSKENITLSAMKSFSFIVLFIILCLIYPESVISLTRHFKEQQGQKAGRKVCPMMLYEKQPPEEAGDKQKTNGH